jgi:serine/threonine protein kinase
MNDLQQASDNVNRVGDPGTPCRCGVETLPAGPNADSELATVASRQDIKARRKSATNPPSVPGYEILDELGRGSMSDVYLASEVGGRRVVALKVMTNETGSGRAPSHRFREEAEILGQLRHPHIVAMFQAAQVGDRPYLALESMAGGSLAQRLVGQPWAARPAAELVLCLARAMEYVHQQGIIHRDLKPGNVLLAVSDHRSAVSNGPVKLSADTCLLNAIPKIADFGLAKRFDAEVGRVRNEGVVGTPGYMAPEQAAGKGAEVGPAADIYGLGAILYHLLTGRPTFRARTALDTLQQVLTEEPLPPSKREPSVPPALEAICLKCLRREPADRYRIAGDLAADLTRFLAEEPGV